MMKTLSKRIDWQKNIWAKNFLAKRLSTNILSEKGFLAKHFLAGKFVAQTFLEETQGKKFFLQNKTCLFIVLPEYSQKIVFLIF